ncbi:MAG: prepilin peptidase [Selenomonadaceae bacterium]|nr:prepilin peptidase [Selenomonadaceae bacterium]
MIFIEILIAKIIFAAILTVVGSIWIDKLYSNCQELTFPEEISRRARFRKPILFLALIFLTLNGDFWIMSAIFFLLLMTVTDFEQYMLFDAMTLPFAAIGAVFAWQNSILMENFIAAMVGGGIFLLLAIISKGSLGGGDVKLIFALGFWLGAENLLNVVIFGSIFGGLAALFMILIKKKDRKSFFAYGPYFALSAMYFLLK